MIEQNNTHPKEPVQSAKNIWFIVISVFLTALTVGGGVYAWQNSKLKSTEQSLQKQIALLRRQVDKLQREKTGPTVGQDQSNNTPSDNSNSESITLTNPSVKIYFPNDYSIEKSQEKNRRGTFVSYNFNKGGEYSPPQFHELQFFSEESLRNFASRCGEELCFMGDYPTLERYFGQKEAFSKAKDFTETYNEGRKKEFKLQNFNDRNFFVSFIFDPNGSGYEYTTFIGDIKIDVWIYVENEAQKAQSDTLFSKLRIEEL